MKSLLFFLLFFLACSPALRAEEKPAVSPATTETESVEESGDELPLDAAVSRYLVHLAEEERQSRLEGMDSILADISRICKLDEAQQERLRLAATGAVERSMKEWHERTERLLRSELEKAEPDARKDVIARLGPMTFIDKNGKKMGEKIDLWRDALGDVLSDEQLALYDGEQTKRKEASIDAFTRLSLAMLDERLLLDPTQRAALEKIVKFAVSAHLPEIRQYWGGYLEEGVLLSFANIEEQSVLEKILTKGQLEELKEATVGFEHFWDQKRRMIRAKKKAAERAKGKGGADPEKKEGAEDNDAPEVNNPPKGEAIRLPGPGIRIKLN